MLSVRQSELARRVCMTRILIDDGIAFNILPSDKFKTNYFDFNFILPLHAKTASLNALLPAVLRRGCASYPTMSDLNKKLDSLYAASLTSKNYKRGENQIFGFSSNFLKNSMLPDQQDLLSEVLGVIAEVLYHPISLSNAFRKDYVDSEKRNLLDALGAQMNNKGNYAVLRCYEEMCRNEAYSVNELGDTHSIAEITPESLFLHYCDVLQNARIELFFMGVCDENKLVSDLKSIFRNKVRKPIPLPGTEVIRFAGRVKEVTEEMDVAQGKLSLGFRTGIALSGEQNYAVFTLFNEIFGGSPTSKLFENVREKLSLCYYCRSMPEAHKGTMVVTSGIEVENKQKAQDEIQKQLDLVKAGSISDEELSNAKKSIANTYRELEDDPAALCSWYLSRILAGDQSRPEDIIASVEKASVGDVAAVAQNIALDTVYFLKGTGNDGNGGMTV